MADKCENRTKGGTGRGGKPRSGEYTQAMRMHRLMRLIGSRHGITLNEMAEETGVDRRTIHRDLRAIEGAGYAIDSQWVGSEKTYSFAANHSKMLPVAFTLNQVMALFLVKSQASVFATTPIQKDIDEVFQKVTSVLPAKHAAHLERISRVSVPKLAGVCDYSEQAEQVSAVQRGLLHQYTLRLEYAKQGRGSDNYVVDPYSLVYYRGALYLLGFAHNRAGIRLFALNRVRSAEVTADRFEIPENFDGEGHFAETFGIVNESPVSVVLRFDQTTRHLVSGRIWHPQQQFADLPDGSLQLSFEACGMSELVSWLAGYGGGVKVVEPPVLAERLREHARAILEAYC